MDILERIDEAVDSEDYFNNVVKRYLNELQQNLKNAKNKREKSFYKNRYDVQLKDFSKALGMSEKDIEQKIK